MPVSTEVLNQDLERLTHSRLCCNATAGRPNMIDRFKCGQGYLFELNLSNNIVSAAKKLPRRTG
jgi:hypothetical protein